MAVERIKNPKNIIGRLRFGWSTKVHRVAGDERNAITWSLSAGQTGEPHKGDNSLKSWAHIMGVWRYRWIEPGKTMRPGS